MLSMFIFKVISMLYGFLTCIVVCSDRVDYGLATQLARTEAVIRQGSVNIEDPDVVRSQQNEMNYYVDSLLQREEPLGNSLGEVVSSEEKIQSYMVNNLKTPINDSTRSKALVAKDFFMSVDDFLKKCARLLGIYKGAASTEPFYPPNDYCESELVIVGLVAEDGEKVKLYGIYDPDHQLMNGKDFNPQNRASGGTRQVGFYSIDGQKRLCFKQWPEAPACEIAAHKLYRMIFPQEELNLPLPASIVLLMNDKIFSISEFMTGENLEQFAEKIFTTTNSCEEYQFDIDKFQKLALFCLLTNPEDYRLQNCLVEKIKYSSKYEFILILKTLIHTFFRDL